MSDTGSKRASPLIWRNHRTEVARIIRRLIAATKKPKAISHSVGGARHGWAMTLQDQVDFRALASWSDGVVNSTATKFVISHMVDDRCDTIEDFERLFATDQPRLRQPKLRWSIIIPFYVEPDSRVSDWPPVKVLGSTFQFRTWDAILRQVGKRRIDEVFQRSRIPRDVLVPQAHLVCAAEGRGALDACECLSPALNSLRGMVELLISMYRQPIGWPYKPIRLIPNPGWALAWQSKMRELHSVLFHPHEIPVVSANPRFAKLVRLNQKQVTLIASHVEKDLGKPTLQNDSRRLIADVLRLYSEAMDSPYEHDCFLGFWRCAEQLTLADERDSNRTVIARLTAIVATTDIDATGMTDVLVDLSHKRNDYVHRGILDIDSDDAMFLKVIVEIAIMSILHNLQTFRTTRHIEEFFRALSANDSRLDDIATNATIQREAISVVRKLRRTT
jgi:hypothetical protein